MKIATDLEQSKKLAKILPIESADMYYPYFGDGEYGDTPRIGEGIEFSGSKDIHAWSLSALMNVIPNKVEYEFKTYFFKFETDVYSSGEKYYDLAFKGITNWLMYEDSTEFVDACVEIILKLKEKNLI